MDNKEPSAILGDALAAWGNPPQWAGAVGARDCTREQTEEQFREFVELVCANHGLAIVRIGVLEEA